jgi:hypothetical protein
MNTEAINPICNILLIQYKLLRIEESLIITPITKYKWLNKEIFNYVPHRKHKRVNKANMLYNKQLQQQYVVVLCCLVIIGLHKLSMLPPQFGIIDSIWIK